MATNQQATSSTDTTHRNLFYESIHEKLDKADASHQRIRTKQELQDIISTLKAFEADPARKKRRDDFYILKNFHVMGDEETGCLVYKKSFEEATNGTTGNYDLTKFVRIAALEDTFDIIKTHHQNKGHCGTRNTWESIRKLYGDISRDVVAAYVKLCNCQVNRRVPGRPESITPILSKTFNDRVPMDLIDMQSQVYDEFKWILHYQDHLTKFCYLRALKTKQALGVARALVDIFCIQGAPQLLQSDNGKEFVITSRSSETPTITRLG